MFAVTNQTTAPRSGPDFARLLAAEAAWQQADKLGMERPYDADRLSLRLLAYEIFAGGCRTELNYAQAHALAVILGAWAWAVGSAPGPQQAAAWQAQSAADALVGAIEKAAEANGIDAEYRK